MAIGFCSLDEAWGSSMCPENSNNVQTFSSFENDNNSQKNNVVPRTELDKIKESRNIDLDNSSNKTIVNKNMLEHNNRNIVSAGNPNQLKDRNMHINSLDKIIEDLEKRVSLLENKSNNSSLPSLTSLFNNNNNSVVEYIILIVIGVVIIYFLDKFLNKN